MAAALYLSSIPKPTQTLSFSSSHSNFFNPKSLVVARSRTRIRTQKRLTCTCLFGLGVPELVVIAGVAALVFGPKKLPEVGRSIGKTVKSFQQAAKEFETELKKEPASVTEAPVETPATLSEEKEKDVEVSSKKESL
ncbi:sec-independent protein translocase protein TATA, chloroplastic [Vitis riparia]|uniref:sec-independent protein translocase protein TATA, chloroplastic n=1 Tax=Vitis riparia TaxID=96939 RepID=UPI00155A8213|nr:sec-independent protein translocase protein TATA, chloroplastic [Vitis riparia]